ncbi:hypothetical protein UXU46_02665 [Campylobacter jejuni]
MEGDIAVDLNFPLSEKEKAFGRFAPENRKQIAIISGGLQRYKTYPFEKLQEIVICYKKSMILSKLAQRKICL